MAGSTTASATPSPGSRTSSTSDNQREALQGRLRTRRKQMSSLLTGVSGLRNHQVWLDIIGDNIANTNTPGFKTSTAVFSDILNETVSTGVAPTGETGGTNPIQIGRGMTLGSVSPNFQQGSIQTTNRATDVAIQGEGFFVLGNGDDRVFGRTGAFTLDANGNLVDGATGFKIQGASGDVQITLGQ